MSKKRYYFSLSGLLLSFTLLYTILFPADKINIKEILLLITLVIYSPAIIRDIKGNGNSMIVFYGIVFPVFCILYSIIVERTPIGNALSYGYVWLFLLLVPGIVSTKADILKVFLLGTLMVALAINFIYLADLFGFISIFRNPLILFLDNMKEIQYGKGIAATFGYSIFYKSCPLILISLGYSIKSKRYFLSAIYFLSVIACGTRANFYAAIGMIVLILIFAEKKRSKRFIAIVACVGIAIAIAPNILFRMQALNAIKVNSDSIKTLGIQSVFTHMNAEPVRYIFGSGVGSLFYSTGRNAYVDVIEASYFDYFRQVGVIGFALFLYFIIRPMIWLFRNEKWLLFAYIAYLAIAYSNPLLVTSTSFIAYILIYSCAFSERRQSLLKPREYWINDETKEV